MGGLHEVLVDLVYMQKELDPGIFAVKMRGFDPLTIPYLRVCREREIGVADRAYMRKGV